MIPIARPCLGKEEVAAAREVILSGWVTQGPKVREFENAFASSVNAKYACAVSSCTTALHLALLAVGVKPGDVVITVSHSFIATANSVRHCGAEPVFVDIDPENFNMSPQSLETCLSRDCRLIRGQLFYEKVSKLARGESPLRFFWKKTNGEKRFPVGRVAAILTVHQMGMPCDLKSILAIAAKFHLPVIEDAACAIGSEIFLNHKWEKIGKPHGDIACFSFHPRKLLTTGDGGMLTTNNPRYDKKFRLLRQHGMSISDVKRHQAKKVFFEKYLMTGFNYRMTDIQAAIGIAQLKKLPVIVSERRELASLYSRLIRKRIPWLRPPHERDHIKSNWQSYPVSIVAPKYKRQVRIMQMLLDHGIASKPGIMNAHQEPAYDKGQYVLPQSEAARDQVLLLPLYNGLKKSDLEKIIGVLEKI
jgi:dTDP-4-amino-4,6-dideoxygalactose transaminase